MQPAFVLFLFFSLAVYGCSSHLHKAVISNDCKNLKRLIQNDADVNARDKDGNTPLHTAVSHSNTQIECVKLLIEHGADVNAQDSDGDTPLHLTVFRDDLEYAKLLIEHKADVNAKNYSGDTPLFLAVNYYKNHKMAEFLQKHGAAE